MTVGVFVELGEAFGASVELGKAFGGCDGADDGDALSSHTHSRAARVCAAEQDQPFQLSRQRHQFLWLYGDAGKFCALSCASSQPSRL